MMMVLKSIKTI